MSRNQGNENLSPLKPSQFVNKVSATRQALSALQVALQKDKNEAVKPRDEVNDEQHQKPYVPVNPLESSSGDCPAHLNLTEEYTRDFDNLEDLSSSKEVSFTLPGNTSFSLTIDGNQNLVASDNNNFPDCTGKKEGILLIDPEELSLHSKVPGHTSTEVDINAPDSEAVSSHDTAKFEDECLYVTNNLRSDLSCTGDKGILSIPVGYSPGNLSVTSHDTTQTADGRIVVTNAQSEPVSSQPKAEDKGLDVTNTDSKYNTTVAECAQSEPDSGQAQPENNGLDVTNTDSNHNTIQAGDKQIVTEDQAITISESVSPPVDATLFPVPNHSPAHIEFQVLSKTTPESHTQNHCRGSVTVTESPTQVQGLNVTAHDVICYPEFKVSSCSSAHFEKQELPNICITSAIYSDSQISNCNITSSILSETVTESEQYTNLPTKCLSVLPQEIISTVGETCLSHVQDDCKSPRVCVETPLLEPECHSNSGIIDLNSTHNLFLECCTSHTISQTKSLLDCTLPADNSVVVNQVFASDSSLFNFLSGVPQTESDCFAKLVPEFPADSGQSTGSLSPADNSVKNSLFNFLSEVPLTEPNYIAKLVPVESVQTAGSLFPPQTEISPSGKESCLLDGSPVSVVIAEKSLLGLDVMPKMEDSWQADDQMNHSAVDINVNPCGQETNLNDMKNHMNSDVDSLSSPNKRKNEEDSAFEDLATDTNSDHLDDHIMDDHLAEVGVAAVSRRSVKQSPGRPTPENFNHSEAGPEVAEFTEEEFRSAAEVFKDPSTFEFLERASNTKVFEQSALSRLSLYVKFDPLVSQKPELGRQATFKKPAPPQRKSSPVCEEVPGGKLISTECSPSRRESCNNKLIDFHSPDPPLVGKANMVPVEPIQRIDNMPLKVFTEDDMKKALQINDLLFQERLIKKEKELIEGSRKHQAQMETLTASHNSLQQAVSFTRSLLEESNEIMRQWQEKKEQEKAERTRERDQSLEDLRSVEASFSELHKRYEKMKAVLEGYKQNEVGLRAQLQDTKEKLAQEEENNEMLQLEVQEKLNKANVEIESARRSGGSEIAVLQSQLMKAEMEISSLDKALEQKVQQLSQLTQIYDDLVARVSGRQA